MKQVLAVSATAALLTIMLAVTGCTITTGRMSPKAQYVYPNSNVTIVGPVKAEASKTGILIPPTLTIDDMKKVYKDALAQASGANVIVNMKEDTSFTSIWIFYTVTYKIEGEAARMEVGRQELK